MVDGRSEKLGSQSSKARRPRTRKSEATRQKILSAAIGLVAEAGFSDFSMRALGDRLGVTPMMPYRHFSSKEALFVEIRRVVFDRFGEHLELCAQGGRTPESKLRRLCYGYLCYGCKAPDDYELIFGRWNSSDYRAVLEADGENSLHMTRSWMAMLVAVANLREAATHDSKVVYVSHLLWESLHGLVGLHLSKKLGFGVSLEDLAGFVVENLMKIAGDDTVSFKSPMTIKMMPAVRPVIAPSLGALREDGAGDESQ